MLQLKTGNKRKVTFHFCLPFLPLSSLLILLLFFLFYFPSVCGGGQETRRPLRRLPDRVLDSLVLLLSVGHADIMHSQSAHVLTPYP